MKRIIKSALLVLGVAAIAGYATFSFFSDTETSTGNTFTAGAIDLKIDNTSYVSNKTTGALEASINTSWPSGDLNPTVNKFFDIADLKPGDIGEDTISFIVNSNPAWVCAEIEMKTNLDNSCTEPEGADETGTSCTSAGELADQINFMWWPDDGDNVLESNEADNAFFLGPKSIQFLMDQGTPENLDNNKLELTLADKHVNFFNKTAPGTPINPNQTYYVGKGWCFGAMAAAPVVQDNVSTSGPLTRGTGFTCNGSQVDNTAQTDSLTADLKFTAIQSRNNM